jgi:hypothetical protein
MRRFDDLQLLRSRAPIIMPTFTAMHRIEPYSPLHGATRESLPAQRAELLVTVTAMDETTPVASTPRTISRSTTSSPICSATTRPAAPSSTSPISTRS